MVARPAVVVFGAGSVGCYLGARLAAAGYAQITLLGRPRLVEAVRARELRLDEAGQEIVVHPRATADAGEVEPADLTILTVRTFDVAAALPDARRLMGDAGLLVAMQNGLGIDEEIARQVDASRLIAGSLTTRVDMDDSGHVVQSGSVGGVALASAGAASVPSWVPDLFRRAGLSIAEVQDARSLRWSKLLLNLVGAATTAILDEDMAEVVNDPALFGVEQRVFREAGAVMDGLGVRAVALPAYPVPLARWAMRLPRPLAQRVLAPRMASARGGRSPNLRGELARGRTEVDALHGAVARAAEEAGMRAPLNAALAHLIGTLSQDAGKRAVYRRRPDLLLSYLESCGVGLQDRALAARRQG